MSVYYNYYICRRDPDTSKIYPLFPFDKDGKLIPALWYSGGFSTELARDSVMSIDKSKLSEELVNALYPSTKKIPDHVEYGIIFYEDLGSDEYYKKGYFLNKDIDIYEQDYDVYNNDIFYDHLTQQQYLRKLEKEIKYGIPKEEYDDFGEPIPYHPCSDYSYYAYPDYWSKEYDVHRIKTIYKAFSNYVFKEDNKDIVILLVVD